jgi:hypothetical protein
LDKFASTKSSPKVTISLGYFMFSINHKEPPKVTQLAKNPPIWSPWLGVACRDWIQTIGLWIISKSSTDWNAVDAVGIEIS